MTAREIVFTALSFAAVVIALGVLGTGLGAWAATVIRARRERKLHHLTEPRQWWGKGQ